MALTEAQEREKQKHIKYWTDRETEAKKHYITDEKEYEKELHRIYEDMLDNVQKEIDSFYAKYANQNGLTLAEAKKRVSSLDVKKYERKAKRFVAMKDFSKHANDSLRLYNATMKINRLEMLKANIGLELISGHDELEKFMGKILQGRTMEELERQAGILGKTIKNNAQTANAIVNASFHNAKFSDRVWMYQDLLKNELNNLLQSGLIAGKNPRVLAAEIKKRFDVKTSDAERLMRTELARVQTEAQKQAFERNGFTMYTFLALGDACPICADINGNHYKVADMMPGLNAPPMHPHCRCSTAAYEDTDDYNEWLEFLANGGTTEEYERRKTKSEELTNRRKERMAARKAQTARKQQNATNMFGEEIVFDESITTNARQIINKLAEEYETRLRTVKNGALSKKAAGIVDIGGNMYLSSRKSETPIHEFAHSIAMEETEKLGLTDNKAFWKEIKKVHRQYKKDVGDDATRWISSYEHSSKGHNEFLAEAFTHAKAREMGIDLTKHYGSDYTYSQQVLDIVDKYFKKKLNNRN